MKRFLLLLFLGLGFWLQTGCSRNAVNSPVKVAYVTEGTTISTIDAAMKAWAVWVNQGRASAQQVESVRTAYRNYYETQEVVLETLRSLPASADADTVQVILNNSNERLELSERNLLETIDNAKLAPAK